MNILQSISQNFCQNIPNFVPKFASSLRTSKVHIEIHKPVCKQRIELIQSNALFKKPVCEFQ